MNNKTFRILFARDAVGLPETVIEVEATVKHERPIVDADVVKMLREAVTQWVKTSEIGKKCYTYAMDDLNIGDIASHCHSDGSLDEDLIFHLENAGLHDVKIHDFNRILPYDTVLVN